MYSLVLLIFSLLLFHHSLDAQGPPIITDTPILLGLEGRAIMARSMIIQSTTLYSDGERIDDPEQREITAGVFPIGIPYNVTRNLLVGVMVPVMSIRGKSVEGSQTSTGLGDITVTAKYLILQHDRLQETFRIAAKTAIKFPSGDEKKQPALGTGTYDVSAGAVAGWIGRRFGVYGDVLYSINGRAAGIARGNSLKYNAAIGYRGIPDVYDRYPMSQLNLYLEFNGEYTRPHIRNNEVVPDTGGNVIYISPGIQYIPARQFLLEGFLQIPAIQSLSGTQLGTDYRIGIGIRLLLY
jgi:hypothetical protein